MEGKYEIFTAGPGDEGRTVKEILKKEMGLSERKMRSVKFDPKGLLVNGERVTVRRALRAGDALAVLVSDAQTRPERLSARPMQLKILWEDDTLIAVDKPAGTVCHPSAGHREDSLANALRALFDERGERASVHLMGRLDKETSGIVLCAKSGIAAARLLKKGKIRKVYTAAAKGRVDAPQVIRLPLSPVRDEDGILKSVPDPETGKEAETEILSSRAVGGCSVLRVRIGTGRMHQIRCHLAAAGHPLLGDALYGDGDRSRIGRTALHAGEMTFVHPATGETVRLTAELPEDMKALCE